MRRFWFLAVIFFVPAVVGSSYFVCKLDFCKKFLDKSEYSGPIDKITVANIGEYSIFNLIADKQGFFEDNGLDVDMIEYSSGPPAVADLLVGKVNFAVAADFVGVRNIFINQDLRIIAEVNKHYTFEVIGRRDKGILTPANLRDKKIGVTRKGVGEFFLGRFLSFNGLGLSDVRVIDLSVPEIIDQINGGEIDVAVIFNPHAYSIKKTLGENAISWSAQDDQRVYALLYSTGSFLRAQPDIAARYIRALFKAEEFLKKNQLRAKMILSDHMHYDIDYVDSIWDNFDFTISLSQSLFLSMEDQARFIMENNLASGSKVPNYLDYIYLDAIEEVMPDRISIIR